MLTQTVTQPTLTLRPEPTVVQEEEDIAKFDYGPPPPTFEDKHEERKYLKERLALAYRVLSRECNPEGSAGHLSVRDPVDPACFWVNPFGLHFSRMTASDLLLVDHAGRVVGGGRRGKQTYNAAAFVIHSAIHEARPDVAAVVHAHTPHGKAFSTLGRSLPFYTQDSAVFWNDCALYAAHGGVVLSAKESGEIVGALGKKKTVILQNHGLLAAGGSIESAVAWFMLLENECRCVLAAESAAAMTGRPPVTISPSVAEFTWRETGSEEAGRFEALPFFDLVEEESGGAYRD
ncbi:hypothetical protein CcaverHIS002_0600680 [Cutaneotrichosporon cavernicola]|uniref:Class II aldolase/adducin N-terminal domain-containing protein n=1 Tax=Cutaneotrichosporon cavernicola TaxID=279322 RepID=A0AA48L5P1_9TREE|nr:uncharacterized protein CcaverHIS019_0500770 [Cutaneotrichosporon cavernicola]BEI85781.1 hypothetical protein CcaverHIS002_0600680 [Cutaneotrichosporon cavernicola]BEI92449.1 hypothetical protein CcaverHIS019_0500770 [Cutaneotrichosporon cavernicola]BEJ00222.1 hypothetical protein CcaverHIS631_0500790 [Cutaneotrichosporon cavernicola]BEJ07993.1 hypothetical protein CcaverHIS641_0500780 [Cutaneotrichosporon cavernicola]